MIIYKIVNNINGKIYVGQTIQKLVRRIGYHFWQNKTPIQKAMNKYGIQSFTVSVIDSAYSKEILDEKERYWIKQLNCKSPNGYNLTDGGEGLGNPTDEIRKKISKISTGRKLSVEAREKISNSLKGRSVSKKTRERIGNLNRGKNLSDETKRKMSLSSKGKKKSEQFKENLRMVRTGWKLSEETKKKIREKAKGRKVKKHSRMSPTEETKNKCSETLKRKWASGGYSNRRKRTKQTL
jgi:group I intron endonuclease